MCTNCVFGTEVETDRDRRTKEQKEKRTEGRKEKRTKEQKKDERLLHVFPGGYSGKVE